MHIESKIPDTIKHNYATGSRRLLYKTQDVCKSEWPIKIMK